MVHAVGAALMVGGKVVQGISKYKAGRANAKALKAEARDTMREGAERELMLRDQARKAIGEQAMQLYASGMQGGTGSALDALRESQINAALDVLAIRGDTSRKAGQLYKQAALEKKQAKMGLVADLMGAAGSAIGAQADWGAVNAGSSAGGHSSQSYGDGSNMSGGIRNF